MMLPEAVRVIEGLVACAAENLSASNVAVIATGLPIWVVPLKKVTVPVGALPMLPAVVARLGVVSTSAITVNATFAVALVGGLTSVGYVGA